MNNDYILRHRDLVTDDQLSTPITVVGAGAIGSFVVLALAKMGFNRITVYDFDTVSEENIGSQFYSMDSVKCKKVNALVKLVGEFSPVSIDARDVKLAADTFEDRMKIKQQLATSIVISAVDRMDVRRMIYQNTNAVKLIDPRMAAEYATLQVVDMLNTASRASYEKSLFTDGEAVQERCTAKTTMYTVLLIAGQVVKAVLDVTAKRDYIKSMNWDIAGNRLAAFDNQGRPL
jgi:molybdopterin/thiamine biosynthesis adenylyltransferase